MSFISIYIHIPFCIHRCGYCDFNTYAGLQELIPAYSHAVCCEIEVISSESEEKLSIHTIYFGGGTPSLLTAENIENILTSIDENFDLMSSAEISLEANPGTVSRQYLKQIQALGVNRLSLGMQSANQDELSLLERKHSLNDVVKAVEWAREAGYANLNLDLIFGIPFQDLKTWVKNLETAISFRPEHLSLYALTLEPRTPMHRRVVAGVIPQPDQDLQADMYETASANLAEAGYYQYEISNWSRVSENGQDYACQHNLQYWRALPYIGIGAGAHGFLHHQRTVNINTPREYISRMSGSTRIAERKNTFPRTPATIQLLSLDSDTEIGETMMMGLRLVSEGVSNEDFRKRFGICLQDRFSAQISHLIQAGLLEWIGEGNERLRLTARGRLLGNRVFREFI